MLIEGLLCARLGFLIMLAWGVHDCMPALGLSPVARWGLMQRFRAAAAETSPPCCFHLTRSHSWYVGPRQILWSEACLPAGTEPGELSRALVLREQIPSQSREFLYFVL